MARKKKAPQDRSESLVQVLLPPGVKAALADEAKVAGHTLSGHVRWILSARFALTVHK